MGRLRGRYDRPRGWGQDLVEIESEIHPGYVEVKVVTVSVACTGTGPLHRTERERPFLLVGR